MTDDQKWQITSSRYIVNDRWMKLRADACVTPEGHTLDPFYVIEYKDWVNCLVIDKDYNAIMIRQYRHGVGEPVLEIVAGSTENQDVNPEESIRRELKEELGYVGGDVVKIGESYANPANQTNKIHSFLAFDGSCSAEQELEPGESLRIEKLPFSELMKIMSRPDAGDLFQSIHLANLFFAMNYIRSSRDPRLQSLLDTM